MEDAKKNDAGGFLKQGSILAMASIMVRIIGMIYRVPMANIMGEVGNGIYSAAFEIYNILLVISSYGMPMAVSKLVSSRCSQKRYKNAYHLFKASMALSICTGGAAALFVFFGADWIEHNFFSKYTGIAIPLRVLAPTIFIVAVMGCLRGLYQGRGTMMPTALSQIFEQIVNAFVSVAAAYMLMRAHKTSPDAAAWGAAGGTLGTCLGAVTAFLMLAFIYMLYMPVMKKQERRDHISTKTSLKNTYSLLLATVIPIVLSQTVYQLSGIVDITLFSNVMGSRDYTDTHISTMQGIYSTKYRLLVSVPIAISTAIASSMIPSLVISYTSREWKQLYKKITMAVKFNMIIAFPSAMGLAILAQPIIMILFPNSDYVTGGIMLAMGSSCVIFYALSTVTSGVLQSVDRMNLPVIHSLISLVIHIVLVYVMLQYTDLGVYSLVIGNVTYPILVCYLNGRSVRKCIGYRQEVTKSFCIPFLSSFIMGVAAGLVYYGIFKVTKSVYIAIFPAIIIAVAVYFALVLKMQGLNRNELYEFPMGRRLSIVADKLHLLKH